MSRRMLVAKIMQVARFVSVFLASFIAQAFAVNFLLNVPPESPLHWPMMLYYPFCDLMMPYARKHFGGETSGVGALIYGIALGALVYSTIFSVLVTWWYSYVRDRSSARRGTGVEEG